MKRLSDEDLKQYLSQWEEEFILTDRRLIALRRTQATKPDWSAYDPYVDEVVGIGVRIEEQEAILDELTNLITLVTDEQDRRRGLNQTIQMF